MSSLCVALWEQLALHQLCHWSFLMLSRMPRTSLPFASIQSLPVNPPLLPPSDLIGSMREWNPPLPGSAPCCDLTSPEPAAFLHPLTPLAAYLSLLRECEIGKQPFPSALLLGTTRTQLLCILSLPGYNVYWCLKQVKVELQSGSRDGGVQGARGMLRLTKH